MIKTLTIARKTLTEAWRDRQLTALYLAFPALMVIIFYMGYGATTSMAAYLTIYIDDRDQGPLGREFIQAIKEARFDGQPVFTVREITDPRTARTALEEGKAALLLTLPSDFTGKMRQAQSAPAGQPPAFADQSHYELLGDPLTDTYVFSRSFLAEVARMFVNAQIGWQKPLPAAIEFLPNTGKMSDFQVGVPGVMVFGVLFGVITSALMLAREQTNGTLQRIRLSQASAAQLLGGVTLANLAMALVQVPITFVVALAFGFHSPGSLWLGMGLTLLLSLAATGCGFISACFSHSEGEATFIGTGVMVPLVFLSGAIFPMPAANLFSAAGRTVQVYDIMPSTHAADAMRRVLLYGDCLAQIPYQAAMLAGLSLLALGLGAWLYQSKILNSTRR